MRRRLEILWQGTLVRWPAAQSCLHTLVRAIQEPALRRSTLAIRRRSDEASKVIQQTEGRVDAEAAGLWLGAQEQGLTVAIQHVDSEQGPVLLGGKEHGAALVLLRVGLDVREIPGGAQEPVDQAPVVAGAAEPLDARGDL